MDKATLTAISLVVGKALAAGFYMEIERRLGHTRYGSVLGFVGGMIKKPKEEIKNAPNKEGEEVNK